MNWLLENRIELLGFILSIIYLYLSVKQNVWCWFFGFACSALYVIVFFNSKLYADMSLQFYYVIVSIYGWWNWIFGKKSKTEKTIPIINLSKKTAIASFFIFLLIWGVYFFVLKNYTDSNIALPDSFATAVSIVATWMLTRKIIEHWLLWIFIDSFSIFLFLYKGLHLTAILFGIYTIMAIVGYKEWKKEQKA